MNYYLGLDAGGTKTQCFIGDAKGRVLGEGFGGPGNYQLIGIEAAKASINTAITLALKAAKLNLEDITYGVFGLSGADEAIDFRVLEPMCKSIMGKVQHHIMNDTWIGLRTGAEFGVISICGTGAAHAGKNKEGDSLILRNLYYTLGNLGGGSEVVDKALHFAFRSDEGTYLKTKLEVVIPSLFKVETMDEVCEIIRGNEETVPDDVAYHIPIETMRLATEGDLVAGQIIRDMGKEEGRYAAALINRLGLNEEAVPLVLIGSMFATQNPLLIDPYLEEAKKAASEAYIIVPQDPPVLGALKLAIERQL